MIDGFCYFLIETLNQNHFTVVTSQKNKFMILLMLLQCVCIVGVFYLSPLCMLSQAAQFSVKYISKF